MFEFAATYGYDTRKNNNNDDDLIEGEDNVEDNDAVGSVRIVLKNRLGTMKRRLKPAVIKWPHFNVVEDKESYYYGLLLLYLPFRTESFCDEELASDVRSVRFIRRERQNLRTHTDNPIIKPELAMELDQALIRMTEIANQDGDPLNLENEFELPFEEIEAPPIPPDDVFQPTGLVDQLQNAFNGLSLDQRTVFTKVQDVLLNKDAEQLRLIVSGKGGTGKSHLIRTLTTLIRGHLSREALLLSAPTGINMI